MTINWLRRFELPYTILPGMLVRTHTENQVNLDALNFYLVIGPPRRRTLAFRVCAEIPHMKSMEQGQKKEKRRCLRIALDVIAIFGTAVGLAMDAFSVAVAAGITLDRPTLRHYFRISFHFGLFQFMMPIVGYYAGTLVEALIKNYVHWAAMILLALVGVNMIRESFSSKNGLETVDPSRGWPLVILSVATSIDALAVGISLGLIQGPIVVASVVIGVVCALFSILGMKLGKKAGSILGRQIERVGGVILIGIGVMILLEHLFAAGSLGI